MSNRATRRAELSRFKQDVSHGAMLTHLLDANVSLDGHPTLARAVAWWSANIPTRHPVCICCRASYSEGAQVGAYLFGVPVAKPTSVSVSGVCSTCWRDLPDEDIEQQCLRVLRKIVGPSAHFEDASP